MKHSALVSFRRLRESLTAERDTITKRLAEINEALGAAHLASMAASTGAAAPRTSKRGGTSRTPEWRANLAAAQRARWARIRGESGGNGVKAPSVSRAKGTRSMSAAARARIAAAAKARWAKVKAAGKNRL
jgi:hypothetical protein